MLANFPVIRHIYLRLGRLLVSPVCFLGPMIILSSGAYTTLVVVPSFCTSGSFIHDNINVMLILKSQKTFDVNFLPYSVSQGLVPERGRDLVIFL